MMIQNLRDTEKAVLRGKFTAIRSYLRKQEKSQINNQRKKNKQNTKLAEKIIKIREEINETEMKKTLQLKAGSLKR